jgi:hypothetical protein
MISLKNKNKTLKKILKNPGSIGKICCIDQI